MLDFSGAERGADLAPAARRCICCRYHLNDATIRVYIRFPFDHGLSLQLTPTIDLFDAPSPYAAGFELLMRDC